MPRVNRVGGCPYCGEVNYVLVEVRNPSQDLKQCGNCQGWSATHKANGAQYPLQDRADKLSSPTVYTPD